MDTLHTYGVYFELWLQEKLHGQAEYFLDITKVGDPDRLTLYLFPLVAPINRYLFLRFVLTSAVCDMLNNIFKWILRGQRPYWWIHETDVFSEPPPLKQFPLSCETGPGSPSGHAMITASIWFLLIYFYIKKVATKRRGIQKLLAVVFYLSLFGAVSISRLYIATHFPHQVFLGGIVGLGVGFGMTKIPMQSLRLHHCLVLCVALIVFAAITFSGMLLLGIDPDWTLKLALKHCADRSWVHLSTTPLHALFRDVGGIIGLGLAVESQFYKDTDCLLHSDGSEVMSTVVAFILVQICAWVPIPVEPTYIYYAGTLAKNTAISFVAVAVVPYVVMKVWNLKRFPTIRERPAALIRQESLDPRRKLTMAW